MISSSANSSVDIPSSYSFDKAIDVKLQHLSTRPENTGINGEFCDDDLNASKTVIASSYK
jgi:hypothetical protein